MPLPRLPRRDFGVELETQSGTHPTLTTHEGFIAKSDCSISGLEFVSPVLRGRRGLRRLRRFMRDGRGVMQINRHCGFHAHFDMRSVDLNDQQRFAVAAAYMATETQWFAKVTRSRQDNNYCHHWDERYLMEYLEGAMYRDNFYDRARLQDRYHWLNVRAFVDHGSFENRLHQGTWNFTKVKNWIVLNLRFIRAASKLRCTRPASNQMSVEEFKEKAALCLQWAESGERLRALNQMATTI